MTSTDLNVLINQQPYTVPAGSCLMDAIDRFGIQPPFAAAVNLEFVPRGQYAQRLLQDGDQIELIAPITGG
ncbi:MAG: thiamine biosynthesis protein ThiS [Pseudomonadota bacterium]|jgi:sulfur carrier protein